MKKIINIWKQNFIVLLIYRYTNIKKVKKIPVECSLTPLDMPPLYLYKVPNHGYGGQCPEKCPENVVICEYL